MTTTPLNTVFDLKMQEFSLEVSRREYFKADYLSELEQINYFSRGCREWDQRAIKKLREKYKKRTGYDYK